MVYHNRANHTVVIRSRIWGTQVVPFRNSTAARRYISGLVADGFIEVNALGFSV